MEFHFRNGTWIGVAPSTEGFLAKRGREPGCLDRTTPGALGLASHPTMARGAADRAGGVIGNL